MKKKTEGEFNLAKQLSSLKQISQPNSVLSISDSLGAAFKSVTDAVSPAEVDLAMKIGGGLIKGIARDEKKEKVKKKTSARQTRREVSSKARDIPHQAFSSTLRRSFRKDPQPRGMMIQSGSNFALPA